MHRLYGAAPLDNYNWLIIITKWLKLYLQPDCPTLVEIVDIKIAVIIVLPTLLWNKHISFTDASDDSNLGEEVIWYVPEFTFKNI